jgi:hypothetical protein
MQKLSRQYTRLSRLGQDGRDMSLSRGQSRVALVGILLVAWAAHAQQRNALTLLLSVNDEGSVLAVERLELAAPMRTGLRWRMPVASVGPGGVRRLAFLELLEISDGRGAPLRARTKLRGDEIDVTIPAQPLADNTVRLVYEVSNAVQFHEDRDELYWRVGAGWPREFQEASVSIKMPDRAAGQVHGQLLLDGTPARAPLPLGIEGATATGEAHEIPRGPQALFLDLVFAPGVLHAPSFAQRLSWFLKANPVVFFPFVLLLAMVGFRKFVRRGENEVAVAPRYEPPENLPPAEAGYLVDGRLDHRDLAAILLDLARRGFVRIEAGEPDEGVAYAAPDFILRLLKPREEWSSAYEYEYTMLFHMFYGGQWTKLSSVSLRFQAAVPSIERLVQKQLREKRLNADPRVKKAQRQLAAVLVAGVAWAAQAAGWFAVAQSKLLFAAALLSCVPIVLLLGRGVDHRTAAGARVYAQLRGFQMFLDTVEADRMEQITPELFARYLPYAVALGVEHHWTAAFSTISSGPPLWWGNGKGGGISEFVHLLGRQTQPPRRTKRDQVSAYPAARRAGTGA